MNKIIAIWAAKMRLPAMMNEGDTVRVTFLTYGGAVYDRNGKITNADQAPYKSVKNGKVYFVGLENGHGPVTVKCKRDDGSIFSFYPHKTGDMQKVEIIK